MGNDGTKRVPSPASADLGFAVSSASFLVQPTEQMTASRVLPIMGLDLTMETIMNGMTQTYISSYGSNIISATAAEEHLSREHQA